MSLDQYTSQEDLKAALRRAIANGDHDLTLEAFTDLARLAVLAEREACAQIIDAIRRGAEDMLAKGIMADMAFQEVIEQAALKTTAQVCAGLAAAIRARSA